MQDGMFGVDMREVCHFQIHAGQLCARQIGMGQNGLSGIHLPPYGGAQIAVGKMRLHEAARRQLAPGEVAVHKPRPIQPAAQQACPGKIGLHGHKLREVAILGVERAAAASLQDNQRSRNTAETQA